MRHPGRLFAACGGLKYVDFMDARGKQELLLATAGVRAILNKLFTSEGKVPST